MKPSRLRKLLERWRPAEAAMDRYGYGSLMWMQAQDLAEDARRAYLQRIDETNACKQPGKHRTRWARPWPPQRLLPPSRAEAAPSVGWKGGHVVEHDVIAALRMRQIRARQATPLPGFAVALSMSVVDLERFLDIIVKRPMSGDDALAMRIIGRSQDLTPTDEPWKFELVPGISDAGFEFRVIANVPDDDVIDVLYRLTENETRHPDDDR